MICIYIYICVCHTLTVQLPSSRPSLSDMGRNQLLHEVMKAGRRGHRGRRGRDVPLTV